MRCQDISDLSVSGEEAARLVPQNLNMFLGVRFGGQEAIADIADSYETTTEEVRKMTK